MGGNAVSWREKVIVTKLTPPESGWPMVFHCFKCKRTVILLSDYAIKPERGELWIIEGLCMDVPEHNLDFPPVEFPLPEML